MSRSREEVQRQLTDLLPGFGARQGSQTLTQLANRNNVSRQALEVIAQARARAEAQQRLFVKQQEQALRLQQEQEQRAANIQREAQSQYETVLNSIGDERTRQVLSENGTLSSQVQKQLQAQYQNLQATGDHIDKDGNLTVPAAALQGALQQATQQSQSDLVTRFGGDETARTQQTVQDQRNLTTGALGNFANSAINAAGTGFVGLPLQGIAALAGDTAIGRAAGRFAANVAETADANDVVTPEEQQFRQEFADSEGFLGGLQTIASNPGQALQTFGPSVVGGLGAGALFKQGGRFAARRLAPELAERGGAALAGSNAFVRGTAATAPAVFAGGASDFTRGAEEALNSETDDIGSFAQRGLATSAIGAAAGGVVGAAGGSTLDAPLFRARQAVQQPLQPATGVLGRAGRFARNTGSEAGRGFVGEGFQEGVEGAAQDVSAQIGEGTSLAELDLARTSNQAQLGAAAGSLLGAGASTATGAVTSLRRRETEDALRADLNEATGVGTPQGVTAPRANLGALDDNRINGTLGGFTRTDTTGRIKYVLDLANELNINSTDVTAADVEGLVTQSTVGDEVDATLFRENIGQLLGVELAVDASGKAVRAPDEAPEVTPAAAPVDTTPTDETGAVDDIIADPIEATATPATDAILGTEESQGGLDLGTTDTLDDPDLGILDADQPAAADALEATAEPVVEPPAPAAQTDIEVIDEAATATPDTRSDGILDDETEASFGDIPSIARLRASTDGSPQAQAREDFETNMVRQQIRDGNRQLGDNRGAGQLQIELILEQLAEQEGIAPEARAAFFEQNRPIAAQQYRAARDEAIANNAANFQPIEQAPAEPVAEVDINTREPSFVRDASELNLIVDESDPSNAILPQALRTALLGGLPLSTERRGLKPLSPEQREALRDQYIKADDLRNSSDLRGVKETLRRMKKAVDAVYKVSAKELREGTGVVPLKRKGTDATRAKAISDLQKQIPEDLAKIRTMMTPEGYQRVFGKKP